MNIRKSFLSGLITKQFIHPINTMEIMLSFVYSRYTLHKLFPHMIKRSQTSVNSKSLLNIINELLFLISTNEATFYDLDAILLRFGVNMQQYFESNINQIICNNLCIDSVDSIKIHETHNSVCPHKWIFNLNGRFFIHRDEIFLDDVGYYKIVYFKKLYHGCSYIIQSGDDFCIITNILNSSNVNFFKSDRQIYKIPSSVNIPTLKKLVKFDRTFIKSVLSIYNQL